MRRVPHNGGEEVVRFWSNEAAREAMEEKFGQPAPQNNLHVGHLSADTACKENPVLVS